jgi:hypothetical protein
MKKTRVYSVRLKNLTQITPKCHKAIDWQGNEYLIPDSQYFGRDYDVIKSDAFWIAAWIIDKEDCGLMVSTKKEGWYNPNTGIVNPPMIVHHHIPERIEPKQNNTIQRLKK